MRDLPQGKDDITGEPLVQHDDDKPEALMARLRHYKDVAKPVMDLYKSVNTSVSWLYPGLIAVSFLLQEMHSLKCHSIKPE